MTVVASWSGGKDSCFACFKAIQEGFEISNLLTMMATKGRSDFHLIRADLLDAQAAALGIPLTKQETTPDSYEQEFKNALRQLKIAGVQGVVTGDIYDVPLHEKGWLDRVCGEIGLRTIRPLWNRNTEQIFREFVTLGFEAIVTRVNTKMLSPEWLGRQLNEKFLEDIKRIGNVDPCGENGEYHTFVIDGPLFTKRIEILESQKDILDGSGCLEIERFAVNEKRKKNSK